MKLNYLKCQDRSRPIWSTLATAALVLLGAMAQGQPFTSPVGTWDCILSGARSGIAYLTFTNSGNGTFSGVEILVPKPAQLARTSLIAGDIGTNGLGLRPPGNAIYTNLFGGFPAIGHWGIDSKGRVIGFFTEVYQIQEHPPILATNTLSFQGTVAPGRRLTLVGYTPLGNVLFRGVPAVPLSNLSGEWYGVKRQNGLRAYEFFHLTNYFALAPNAYTVTGNGAGYAYTDGLALLSSQKQMALALQIYVGTNRVSTRSVVGPFNSRKFAAATSGLDSPPGMGALTNRVSFQATKRTSLP